MAVKKKNPTFEEELARLETMADEIEGGGIPLEELSARCAEAMKLAADLEKRLELAACGLKTVQQGKEGVILEESSIAEPEARAAEEKRCEEEMEDQDALH